MSLHAVIKNYKNSPNTYQSWRHILWYLHFSLSNDTSTSAKNWNVSN